MVLLLGIAMLLQPATPLFAQTGSGKALMDRDIQGRDIQGHWAEKQIQSWLDQGWVSGYPDGTFRPDQEITRAEFATLVNRRFQFQSMAALYFSDVVGEWFADEIAKAVEANYLTGYPDGTIRPNNPISRQEAAVVINRLLDLSTSNRIDAGIHFSDAADFPSWAIQSIAAVAEARIMEGYPDGTFRPGKSITRAEAVATLDRVDRVDSVVDKEETVLNEPGIFGSEEADQPLVIQGNVTINVPDVTLQNVIIFGDLLLAAGIAEGDATLDRVTVHGTTTVNGGGANSIHVEHSSLSEVVINKEEGNIRIVVSGSTSMREIVLRSGAILEEMSLEGEGFGNVVITSTAEGKIILSGDFENVHVQSPGVSVEIKEGSVQSLTIADEAEGTDVHVRDHASINRLLLFAPSSVTGKGSIRKAEVHASGSSLEHEPEEMTFANPGMSIVVGDKEVTLPSPQPVIVQPVIVPPGDGDGNDGGTQNGGNEVVPVSAIQVEPRQLTLNVGEIATIVATVQPAEASNKQVKWSSDNETIATVDRTGKVNAVSKGKATLTVTSLDNQSAMNAVIVNVIEAPVVTWQSGEVAIVENFQGSGQLAVARKYRLMVDENRVNMRGSTVVIEGEESATFARYPHDDLWIAAGQRTADLNIIVTTEQGTEYKAMLEWAGAKEATVSFQAPSEASAVFIGSDAFGHAQVDFREASVNQLLDWTAIKEEYYAIALKVNGIDTGAHNVKQVFRQYENGMIIEPSIEGDSNTQYVTTDWQTGKAATYYVLADDTLHVAYIRVLGLMPKPYVIQYESIEDGVNFDLSVSFGTSSQELYDLLMKTVEVAGSGHATGRATIAWQIEAYNEAIAGDYVAIGILTLPSGWEGHPAPIMATITIHPLDTILVNIRDESTTGVTLHLDPALDGLTMADVWLLDEQGNPVAIDDLYSANAGASYQVQAELAPGRIYTFGLAKEGYVFSDTAPVIRVPLPPQRVTASVVEAWRHGFTLKFEPGLPGLTSENLTLTDRENGPVVMDRISTIDHGETYVIEAFLDVSALYEVTIARAGYDLGTMPLTVQATNISVALTATELFADAITIELDTPLSILSLRDFKLALSDGTDVSDILADAKTTDGGHTYRITGTFMPDTAYVLSVSNPPNGYMFSTVPINIQWTDIELQVEDLNGQEFTLHLSPGVSNLKAADLAIVDVPGHLATILSVTEVSSDGSSYKITAQWTPLTYYEIELIRPGLRGAVDYVMPKFYLEAEVVEVKVDSVTLSLTPPFAGLLEDLFLIQHEQYSGFYSPYYVKASEQGNRYRLEFPFNPGGTYTVTADYWRSGYEFKSPVTFTVPLMEVEATLTRFDQTGFSIALLQAVEDPISMQILDSDNNEIRVISITSQADHKIYDVHALLTGGKTYTVILSKKDYNFGEPLTFTLPIQRVEMGVTDLSGSEFILTLAPAVPGLEPGDFELKDARGASVVVANAASDDGASYTIAADWIGGETYTIVPRREGYDFGEPLSLMPPIIEVSASVSDITVDGFIRIFSEQVSGLKAEHVSLTSEKGEFVTITGIARSGNDPKYTVSAKLTRGAIYGLELALPGYALGEPVHVIAPPVIQVEKTISNPSISGFILSLDPAVPDLKDEALIVLDEHSERVHGITMISTDEGATYSVAVSLLGEHRYSVNLNLEGHDFGSEAVMDVPLGQVSFDVQAKKSGFTLILSSAVPGLTDANIEVEPHVEISDVNSHDGGTTYTLAADLVADTTYTVSLTRAGYDFGYPVSLTFREPMEVTDVMPWGFTLKFDPPLPDLSPYQVDVSFKDSKYNAKSIHTDDGGASYSVNYDFMQGTDYTISVSTPSGEIGSPVTITAPWTPSATFRNVSTSGFTLMLDGWIQGLELTTEHIRLTTGEGEPVPIVILDTSGAWYHIAAELSIGESYTVAIHNTPGYHIRGLPAPLPEVAQAVNASFSEVSIHGFKLHLSYAVEGLTERDLILRDVNRGQDVAGLSLSTNDHGYTYRVSANPALVLQGEYLLSVNKAGFVFKLDSSYVRPRVINPRVTIADVDPTGLNVTLDPAVPNLTKADFTVCVWPAVACVAAEDVIPGNNGDYLIRTTLERGKEYALKISQRSGYDFGEPQRFKIPIVEETIEIVEVSATGFTFHLSSALEGLVPGNLKLLEDNNTPLTIQSIDSPDNGRTYEVGVALRPGRANYLTINKAGYNFGAIKIVSFTQQVTVTISEVDATGYTIHFSPAWPDLTDAHLGITDSQGNSMVDFNRKLETADGGASYRHHLSLRGGETYNLKLPDRFGYDHPQVQIVVPALAVSATISDVSTDRFNLNLDLAIPDLTASDILLTDEQGNTITINRILRRSGGTTYEVYASLTGGAVYNVLPMIQGYDFGVGFNVTVPMPVDQQAAAWMGGIRLQLNPPVPGLTIDHFSLESNQGESVSIEDVEMFDNGASYIIKAKLTYNRYYELQLRKDGFEFERLMVLAKLLSSQVMIEGETHTGFTLIFDPVVADLRSSDLTIIDATNGQEIASSVLGSVDDGRTYTVVADLLYGHNYRINVTPYGYATNSAVMNLNFIVGQSSTRNLSETGFTFTLHPAVKGLVSNDLLLTGPDGARVDVTGLTSVDGGSTYVAEVALLPGGRYHLRVQPTGYNFGGPFALQVPPPTVHVMNASSEGITLQFTPALPGLDVSNFKLQGFDGLQLDLAFADSTDGGNSYLLRPTEPLPDGALIGIFLEKAFFDLGATLTAQLPYRVKLSVSDVRSYGFTLHLDRPVTGLLPEEVTLTDEQNRVFRPYALVGNLNGDIWESKIDLAGGQTYRLGLDASDLEAGPIDVAFPLGVMPTITAVTDGGFTLVLSLAVDGLDGTDLLLTSMGSQVALEMTDIMMGDNDSTYNVQVALTPGQVYELSLNKTGHDFLRTVRLGFGLPPVLTDAFISADGSSLLLTFDKSMVVPDHASAGFTVTVDGVNQSFTSAKAGSSSNELVLELETAIEDGAIVLAYIPGVIQAADYGRLEEIPSLEVHHLARVNGFAIFLRGQGNTLAQIGQALQAQLGADLDEIAQGLATLSYPAIEIATALMAAYPDSTAADAAAALGHAGLDSLAVATALGLHFGVPIAQTPALLQAAGYSVLAITRSLADLHLTVIQAAEALSAASLFETAMENGLMVAASLQEVYGATAETAAQALFAVGAPAGVALEALITVYGGDLSTVARALAVGGYGANRVSSALVAYDGGAASEVTNVLTGAGYTAVQIEEALVAAFAELTLPDVLLLLWEAGHETQAIATVLVARTYTAEQAYHLLLSAGYGLDSLMQILAQGYGAKATAEGLKAAGMAFDEIGGTLKRVFGLSAVQAGTVMQQAGYSMDEAAQVLHPAFGLTLKQLGNILSSNFRITYEEEVVAFRKAGVGIAAVSRYLREEIGAVGHIDQTGAGMLKAAGYDVAEVTEALRSFITGYSGGVPAYAVANRLRGADYTAAEAIQGLEAVYSDDREVIVYAVSYAYDVDEAVEGIVARWGVDPEGVARWVRHGALVRIENYLPLSPYDVGLLLRDHLGPDPARLINSLRAEEFPLGYVADVMVSFYDGYERLPMLTGLRAAGYPIAEIIVYLDAGGGLMNSSLYKEANVTAAELGAYMLSQGYTARQFAIQLDAYDALEIALAIRSVYNLDNAAATAALSGISGGAGERFSGQEVAEAVGIAYDVDVIGMVAGNARTKGDTAAAVAWMLKQIYHLDLLVAAQHLKGAGYSQTEVLQGLLAAYCGESKWSASTYRSLALVLTDVYGVVDSIDKPLAVLQALGANLRQSDQVYMLRQWSFSQTEIAAIQRHIQFSPGESLEFMRDSAPIPTEEMLIGVAAAYAISRTEALVDWLRLKRGDGIGREFEIAGLLAFPGSLGWQDSAEQLQALGYKRTEVINAIKHRWSGSDAYKYPAWISHVLFGETDLGGILAEMHRSGSRPGELQDALTFLYPNMDLGQRALLLREAGLSSKQLVTWVLELEPKDESVYPILNQLGLTARDAFYYVLGRWGVPIEERVAIMDQAGYTPAELFFAISSDAVRVVRGYKQLDKPVRAVAYGLTMHYYGGVRRLFTNEIASHLYGGGYSLDEVAFAMAPPRIAYDSDIVPAGEYRGAPLEEYGCSIMRLVPEREIGKVALAITRAKANQNAGNLEQYPMDLSDVAFFIYSCAPSNGNAAWDALKAITSTQAWNNSVNRLGGSWSQNKIVLRSLLEVRELSSYTAAHILRAKGYTMDAAWLEMMAVGLDFWTARVSVTDAYPGETAVAILSQITNLILKEPSMDIPKFWSRGAFITKWVSFGVKHIPD